MIKGIKFVSVPVRDQDKALDFYTKKLGFTVVTDQPFNDTQRWIELRIRGTDTNVVLFTPDGHEDRIGTHQPITFVSDNVKKTYDELQSRGVEFGGEPTSMDWGTFTTFSDQDGNKFVLSSK